ncbi:hypothetical protein EI94DRAFT_1195107 [Lactarius quietus]|nr:hypothetical protein EI94DRAFT_1195107 [Lactarius quietus]
MTVLFRTIRSISYLTVLLLAGVVLGIASYLASQFLPTFRFAFTTYALVTPSFTIAALFVLLYESRPWIETLFLLISSISWLAAWARDINGPAECDALGSSRTQTVHGSISSKAFCYESMILEAFSWTIFILRASIMSPLCASPALIGGTVLFFLLLVITLANRSQIQGWTDIWHEDIVNLPWFGQYPGYPGYSLYSSYLGPQDSTMLSTPASTPFVGPSQNLGNGGIIQHQPGHSVVIWPGVNGGPPIIEQRPGFATLSTVIPPNTRISA